MKWCALFSQTGSEILKISEKLNKYPDAIITHQDNEKINPKLISSNCNIIRVGKKPTSDIYRGMFSGYDIITLHGWLRIIPPDICNEFRVYNGHPGLITVYPELKGKDPQIRAWQNQHKEIGCVIHQVTSEVDGGPVLEVKSIENRYKNFEEFLMALHENSSILWLKFLKEKGL